MPSASTNKPSNYPALTKVADVDTIRMPPTTSASSSSSLCGRAKTVELGKRTLASEKMSVGELK
jgi:hypothetical protein